MALIGLIVSMLLPAIQAVRESARSTSCKNKIRQLNIALLSYESAIKTLPPGTLGFEGTISISGGDFRRTQQDPSFRYYLLKNQNTSLFVHILPFLERKNLADQLPAICTNTSQSYEDYRNQNGGPEALSDLDEVAYVMSKHVNDFSCPSDSIVDLPCIGIGGQPAFIVDQDTDAFLWIPSANPVAGTNFAGCSGAYSGGNVPSNAMEKYDGIFGSRNGKPLARVGDGLSNSIIIGETLGQIVGTNRTSSNPWFFATLCRARSDLDWETDFSTRTPGLELLGDGWFSHPAGFASMHPTKVNFGKADGSVLSLGRKIDWRTLYSLCGVSDGDLTSDY